MNWNKYCSSFEGGFLADGPLSIFSDEEVDSSETWVRFKSIIPSGNVHNFM